MSADTSRRHENSRPFTILAQSLDVGILTFAAFTLIVHTSVLLLGTNFLGLRWLLFAVLPIGLVASHATRSATKGLPTSREDVAGIPRHDRVRHFTVVALLVALLAVGLPYLAFWVGGTAFLLFAYARSFAADPLCVDRVARRHDWIVVVGLLLVSAILTSVLHRPDSDDGLLLNLAVFVLDHPDRIPHSADGIHVGNALPLLLPAYKVHTIELLYAWLAWVLRTEPIVIAHLVIPPIMSAVAAGAAVLLLRVWLPDGWALASVAVVGFWVAMGDVHEGFGNHGYVRMFQGKAMLVSALLPYVAYSVIRFVESGRVLHWGVVFATVVAASGLSATGLFVGPLAIGLAAAATWRPTRQYSMRVAATLVTCVYPAALAFGLRGEMQPYVHVLNSDALYGHWQTFQSSLSQILGSGPVLHLQMLGVLGAPALAQDQATRRWLAGASTLYFLLIMNPLLYDFWITHVTSAPVAWRLWWVLPVPAFLAFTMAAPFAAPQERRRRPLRVAGFLSLATAIYLLVPSTHSVSMANGVRIALPRLKVWPNAYRLSTLTLTLTPRGYSALVPREIAMWVTTHRASPLLVAHKENYLKLMSIHLDEADFRNRMVLLRYVSGVERSEDAPRRLADALERYGLGLVASPSTSEWLGEIDQVLRHVGWIRVDSLGCTFWYRPVVDVAQVPG